MDQKVSREILKCFELCENENTAHHNLWATAKDVLRGIEYIYQQKMSQ